MANKRDYLARLQAAISQLHNCGAVWRESVPVHEVFRGKTLWRGDVEVFDLTGHPKAKRAYGWSHPDGADNKTERFVAVLEIPPVDSPQTAVKWRFTAILKKGKQRLINEKRQSYPYRLNLDWRLCMGRIGRASCGFVFNGWIFFVFSVSRCNRLDLGEIQK